jgi:hypothetical protein
VAVLPKKGKIGRRRRGLSGLDVIGWFEFRAVATFVAWLLRICVKPHSKLWTSVVPLHAQPISDF